MVTQQSDHLPNFATLDIPADVTVPLTLGAPIAPRYYNFDLGSFMDTAPVASWFHGDNPNQFQSELELSLSLAATGGS